MFCPECGEKNQDEAVFCLNCGTKFPERRPDSAPVSQGFAQPANQGYTQGYDTASNPRYQQPQGYGNQPPGYGDPRYQMQKRPSAFHYICSFFCFPLGIIFYLDYKDVNPEAAKNLGIITIISFVLFIINSSGF